MRSSLAQRVRAVEAKAGRHRHLIDMTDRELWEVLDLRDPITGAPRMDASDDELAAIAGHSR